MKKEYLWKTWKELSSPYQNLISNLLNLDQFLFLTIHFFQLNEFFQAP